MGTVPSSSVVLCSRGEGGSVGSRVVVTGLGLWTSLGRGMERNWKGFLGGASGIAPIPYWGTDLYSTKLAAPVASEGAPYTEAPDELRQGFLLFESVVAEALGDAGLAGPDADLSAVGLAAGTSVNHIDWRQFERMIDFLSEKRPELDVHAFRNSRTAFPGMFPRTQGELISRLCMRSFQLGGPAMVLDTACAASAHAIGEAYRAVRSGRAEAMVAGGSAALVRPMHILAFERLRALSGNDDPTIASRPFDRNRDGFVMGEGAGAVVLESLERAQARGARIYAELAGYGSTLSGYTMTDPSPEGEAESRAMKLALEDAGARPEEIGYVAAHGTSTPKGDAIETQAIRRTFAEHADNLLVSSNKGQIGHTISAAGVCNLAVAVKTIETGWVAPTATLQEPDPQCDLDYVPRTARQAQVDAALCNSFAFGGQNAALVVRRVPV